MEYRGTKPKVDLVTIRQVRWLFLNTDMTYNDLAEAYNISWHVVRRIVQGPPYRIEQNMMEINLKGAPFNITESLNYGFNI